MPFAILLKCNKLIAVDERWVNNRIIFEKSKIYFSPSQNSIADFNTETKYFFMGNEVACYDGVVYKHFRK